MEKTEEEEVTCVHVQSRTDSPEGSSQAASTGQREGS